MKSKILPVLLLAGLAVLGVPTQAATLVNQWKFEGNANDTSGSGNNGMVAGSPAYAPGKFGQGLYLNRLDSVQKTNAANLPLLGSDSWSCNVWLYLTNAPDSSAYFAGFGNASSTSGAGQARGLIALGAPSNLGICSWGATRDLLSGQAYPSNQWIMVTITHDGATGRRTIWLNGTNIVSGVQALVTAPSTISVGVAAFPVAEFQGLVDEFTIWQGLLTTNDVASLLASNSIPLIPTIAIPPQSAAVYAGEYASFSVLAGGLGPQTFQWQKGNVGIPGATNATYAINPVTAGDAGNYTVIVSNLNGGVTSSPPAILTVLTVTNIATALGGYWKFDETTGLATADSTGRGNDGTLFNFPGDDSQWVPGKIGGALKFRGPGAGLKDYVQVASQNINPTTTMTISAWVWADALTTWGTIVKNWPGGTSLQFHFGTDGAAGDLSNYLGGPTGGQVGPVREGVGTLLPLGQWNHVALVCNGQTMQLFRNGVPIGTPVAYSGRLNANTLTNSLGIGVKLLATGLPDADNAAPGYWKGKMDDLGIWTRGLTRAEILSIFLAGQAGQPLTNAGSFSVPLPYISGQPQSVTKYAGEYKAQFVVLAACSGALTYQWRADGANVAGATNSVLNLTGPFTNSANYAVVVTDAGNGLSLTSTPAALTVQPVTSITNGLAGYWNFDETNGMAAADSTANARVASLNNYTDDSMWVTGKIGGALNFGGDLPSQYASVANFVQATNHTMTLSAWVWADAAANLASIVDNFGHTAFGQGQFRFGLGSAATRPLTSSILAQGGGAIAATEATGFPTGSWQHVALVADGATLRLYRNGNQVISSAYNGTIVSPSPILNLFIGARIRDDGVNPTPGFWTGKMDDLGMWTRGLTTDEIQAVFAAGFAGRPLTSAVAGTVVKPIVTTPPVSQTVTEGADATFTVAVTGTDPLNYQWRKNGTNILAATNAIFALHSTLLSDAADYAVVVGNVVGSVTSTPPATLTVNALLRPIQAMTNQLVDYWKLDETSGTTALDSFGANNGALQNYIGDNSQWVRGLVGGALQFGGPGPNHAVYVADYPKPDTTMTVAAWVFADARPTWASILKNWGEPQAGQFHFGLNNVTGNLSIYIQQASGVLVSALEGVVLPTNSWQHVAFTCDGTNVWVYRNGIQVASVLYDGTLKSSPAMACLGIGAKLSTACIGTPDAANPGFWQGKMDDIGLWTRSLLALEVQSLYISGLSGRGIDSALLSPPLRIQLVGGNLIFSWPEVAQGRGFVLESTTGLPPISWTAVAGPLTVVDARCFVTVPASSAGNKFYRLRM